MKYFRILLILFLPALMMASEKYVLSIAAIFQNEGPYLREWLEYHKKVGVEHFWLYNNNSQDNYKEILAEYIAANVVELIDWPTEDTHDAFVKFCFSTQPKAFTDAIKRSAKRTKWLALIDLDEFIVPVCETSIPAVLENHFSNVAGVCVNWQCYGTSGVEKCRQDEQGSFYILDQLIYKMKWDAAWNQYSKSIVKPKYVVKSVNPHCCLYRSGYYHVNGRGEVVEDKNNGVYIDKIRVNHYWSRDEWYLYNYKIPRQQKWIENFPVEAILMGVKELNEVADPIIHSVM